MRTGWSEETAKISIVIILYNTVQYIEECIESVVKQSQKPYECIIVNDGSTDGSELIAQAYEKKFPNLIKVINQSNAGAFMARKTGIDYASGDYVVVIDSDDYLLGDCVYRLVQFIEEKSEPDLILFNYINSLSEAKRADYSEFSNEGGGERTFPEKASA